ncbi:MAG: single-stranded-DNA-specific exonuclease RecJ, partial [Sinobacteraceae bacterium]|nr:single-stranded-DNA-specific exonuclease RecJ [Nevskiaceae bacterium]
MTEAPFEPAIRRRAAGDATRLPASLNAVVRRVYANRGLQSEVELELGLNQLLSPQMLGIQHAATLLTDAVEHGRRIIIAGDYDTDGATGTALGVLGLRALGATDVSFVVPNRFTMG